MYYNTLNFLMPKRSMLHSRFTSSTVQCCVQFLHIQCEQVLAESKSAMGLAHVLYRDCNLTVEKSFTQCDYNSKLFFAVVAPEHLFCMVELSAVKCILKRSYVGYKQPRILTFLEQIIAQNLVGITGKYSGIRDVVIQSEESQVQSKFYPLFILLCTKCLFRKIQISSKFCEYYYSRHIFAIQTSNKGSIFKI